MGIHKKGVEKAEKIKKRSSRKSKGGDSSSSSSSSSSNDTDGITVSFKVSDKNKRAKNSQRVSQLNGGQFSQSLSPDEDFIHIDVPKRNSGRASEFPE